MSDYLYCVSDPQKPGLVKLMSSRDDPRIDSRDPYKTRHKVGRYNLEWTLRVVNRSLSEEALKQALRPHLQAGCTETFAIDPMTARGEAVKLTTIRPGDPRIRKPKRSLLKRLFPIGRRRTA